MEHARDCDLDLTVFDEILRNPCPSLDDIVFYKFDRPLVPSHRTVRNKRKEKVVEKNSSAKVRTGSKKMNTIVQLPSAVRSTRFAHFMLDNRFKVLPANEMLRRPELILYDFPRFRRGDALLYFPSAMVTFINNGDLCSMLDLFNSFFHRNCEVLIPMGITAPPDCFLKFQRLINDMHPDQVMCVHSTKAVDNEIRADVYFKLIESKTLYDAVARTSDNVAFPFMRASRAEQLRAKFNLTFKSDEEFRALSVLLDSGADVQLFGKLDMRLLFHSHTKRVLGLKLKIEVTSFCQFDILQG